MRADLARAREALQAIPPDLPRDEWVRVLMAAHAAGLAESEVESWSAGADSFDTRSFRATWHSIKPDGGIGEGTLHRMAAEHGGCGKSRQRPSKASARPVEAARMPRQGVGAAEVWARCKPATEGHGYIVKKDGRPDGLRVVPDGDPLRVMGESVAGCLVVPVLPLDGGEPVSLQFIAPPDVGAQWKAKKKTDKPNLPGASMEGGAFIVGELEPAGTAYLCEGIGTAWSVWKATGAAAVVCFGWGRVRAVAADLRQRDASARLVLVPDKGKEAEAEAIAREVRGEFVTMPSDAPPNFDANDYAAANGHDALEVLLSSASKPPQPPLPFAVVPFADLAVTEPAPPAFVWEGLIPAGHVTLLSAHGGTGKSMVALMLAVAVALGLPLFGIATRRGIVVFYSGEDGAALLRHRLRLICRGLGVNVEDLAGWLFILDATDDDPTLFAEVSAAGRREGVTTATFEGLRDYIAAHDVSLLVVDNASDAFDASEIDRARVRGFMRALARIARERDAGVLLLAHVDKGTSRGDRAGTEGYSGSTAWHNSSRSRLFLSREKDGALLLEQHKRNVIGGLHPPIRLLWPESGLPVADEPVQPVVQGIADRGHVTALLRLIAEFTARGEFITTATTSRTHAAKLLRQEPAYPKLKDGEVFDLLRRAERAGHLERVQFKGADRHQRERWHVTPKGAAHAGIDAGTAGTAATSHVTAPDAPAASPAGTAATSVPGGTGETAPQEVTAGGHYG
jgi:putative DNA primase/helicase